MPSDATAILDPVEFIPERAELALDELGLNIMEEDWGDSDHELFLIRQMRGEIPGDRHPPNRTVTLKLRAREEGATSLADAIQRLQEKVGRLQEEGGFVKRVPDSRGKFSTPVVYVVHTASLAGVHGWLMAHRQVANEIVLTLTVGPYCYGTVEVETTTFKDETNGVLIYQINDYIGSAPGLKRVKVKNIGTNDWLSVIAAWESRDFSEDPTAKLWYKGSELTSLGGGKIGGSAIEVRPTSSWLAFASSFITAHGHMSHVGGRRVIARMSGGKDIEVRLEWRALGSPHWIQGDIVKLPGTRALIDLGGTRPETATLGAQKWEWRLAINKGANEDAFPAALLWDIFLFPTEQYVKAATTPRYVTPTELKNRDGFEQGTGKNLNGLALPDGSGNWTVTGSPTGAEFKTVGDGAAATLQRVEDVDEGTKIATPPGGPYTVIAAQVDVWLEKLFTANSVFPAFLFQGMGFSNQGFGRFYETRWQWQGGEEHGPEVIFDRILFFNRFYPATNWQLQTWYTLTMIISVGQFAVGWMRPVGTNTPLGTPDFISNVSATPGTPQLWDQVNRTGVNVTKAYDNFKVWVPDVDAITFATRGLEFRSEGVFRQGKADDVWARLVPDGFLPVTAPSGLENRPTRGIILPSTGDLNVLEDKTGNKIEASEGYFPGYHFASEAE